MYLVGGTVCEREKKREKEEEGDRGRYGMRNGEERRDDRLRGREEKRERER